MVLEFMSQSNLSGGLVMSATALMLVAAIAFFPWAANAETRELPASSGDVTLSYASVVKRVAPAVVNVYSRRTVQANS